MDDVPVSILISCKELTYSAYTNCPVAVSAANRSHISSVNAPSGSVMAFTVILPVDRLFLAKYPPAQGPSAIKEYVGIADEYAPTNSATPASVTRNRNSGAMA